MQEKDFLTKEEYLLSTLYDIISFATRHKRACKEQQYLLNDLERIEQLTERCKNIVESDITEYSVTMIKHINKQELFKTVDIINNENNESLLEQTGYSFSGIVNIEEDGKLLDLLIECEEKLLKLNYEKLEYQEKIEKNEKLTNMIYSVLEKVLEIKYRNGELVGKEMSFLNNDKNRCVVFSNNGDEFLLNRFDLTDFSCK